MKFFDNRISAVAVGAAIIVTVGATGATAGTSAAGWMDYFKGLDDRVSVLEDGQGGDGHLLYVEDGTQEMAILDLSADPAPLADFDVPDFYSEHLHGDGSFGPNVILVLDKNGNGTVDVDSPAWHRPGGQNDDNLNGDTFVEMDGFAPDVFHVEPDASTQWWTPGNASYYGSLDGLAQDPSLGGMDVVGVQVVIGGSGSWMDTGVEIFTAG